MNQQITMFGKEIKRISTFIVSVKKILNNSNLMITDLQFKMKIERDIIRRNKLNVCIVTPYMFDILRQISIPFQFSSILAFVWIIKSFDLQAVD